MISIDLVFSTLAARKVLRDNNPSLLSWSLKGWKHWLDKQRDVSTGSGQRPLVVLVRLTCIDDLPLHIGAMQLLVDEMLRCYLVLCLPTREAVRLARNRARRDEWHMLVEIVDDAEGDAFLCSLPAETAIAVFPPFGLLSPERSTKEADTSVPQPSFRGTAGDYLARRVASFPDSHPDVGMALRQLSQLDPNDLPQIPENNPPDDQLPSATSTVARPVDPQHGSIEISTLGAIDELIIAGFDEHRAPVAVARCLGVSCKDQLRVRVPARFLTVTPQRIRVEVKEPDTPPKTTDLLLHIPPARIQPWMLGAFLNRGGAGNPVIRAFARAIGCRIGYAEDEPHTLRDIPVVWGVLRESDRILAQAKAQDLYYFYIDHAYFNRGHGRTYRITRNAYEAGPVRRCPHDRVEALDLELLPWRKSGREIIICPPTEYFMKAHNCEDWLERTTAMLGESTDRPIVIRQKPKPGQDVVSLHDALKTTHALVTHSSNVAIEAVCLGTPVFVAPTSAAAPVGTTDLRQIETPAYPDRMPWLAHLAYNQFSFDEIADGRAWRMLLQLEERDFA